MIKYAVLNTLFAFDINSFNYIIILPVALIIYAAVLILLMVYFALKKPKTSLCTLVILGCQVKAGKPSKSLKRRLDVACKYLVKNPDIYCVVSGGKGSDEIISEAECMYRYLLKCGISPTRIIKEDKSVNTSSNIINSYNIIKQMHLCTNLVIATDFYHQLRSRIIAKKCGIKVCGAVSSVPPPKTFVLNTLRELVAVPVEIIK